MFDNAIGVGPVVTDNEAPEGESPEVAQDVAPDSAAADSAEVASADAERADEAGAACVALTLRARRALLAREKQRQIVLDLVGDRGRGVAFSLVDPQLQAVLGHEVRIVLAELINLRGHVPQGWVL